MNKINSNFDGQTIFVGMDVHKSSWNLGIHLNDMFIKNVHQKPNPSIMANYLKQHFPGANYKAAYEAGKFGFWIQRQLTALDIECLVVNPADIPKSQKDSCRKPIHVMPEILAFVFSQEYCMAFIFLMNNRKLTVCSFGIAKGYGKTFPVVKTVSKDCLLLAALIFLNNMIMQAGAIILLTGSKQWIANNKSRRRALDYMISQMEYLRKELLTISNEIRKMMREQRYKTNYYLLRTIPGIGPLTAASILVEIGDVHRFETFYHLNSFVGLLPMEHSSGQSENKLSLTVRKHRQLRSDLVESAWTARRTDPAMALYFQEQIKRKDSKIVIIKIARKLLNRIRFVLVNQQPYEFGIVK